jgi:superfamily II DNA or RNA helicase
MSIINHKGYIIRKNIIDIQVLNSIRNELTVQPNINPNYAEQVPPYPVYFETEKNIYLPRFYGLQKFGPPTKGLVFNPLACPMLETTMTLRDYQIPIITKTLDVLQNTCGGGILELYTGSGKTSIALYLMCQLKVKTLIIVHKSFLLQQWIERIKQFIPNASIGVIQGQVFDVENKSIVIGMLQTLSMKTFKYEQFSEFGLTIVDETHHIGAEVFCRALIRIATKYMIGLSATPIRKDGLTKVIHWFIGPTAYSLQRDGNQAQKVLVKKILFKSSDMSYLREQKNFKGTVLLPAMINQVCDYSPRNALIIHEILYYAREEERQIMVISDRITHLHELKQIIDNGINQQSKLVTGLYTGRQKQSELIVSEKAKIIFSSYAMCREGLDIQSLNTIIFATSNGDVIQTSGRILRKTHNVSPLIIDIADQFSSFKGQSKKRDAFYKKSNYLVIPFNYVVGSSTTSLEVSSIDLLNILPTKSNKTLKNNKDSDDDEPSELDEPSDDIIKKPIIHDTSTKVTKVTKVTTVTNINELTSKLCKAGFILDDDE